MITKEQFAIWSFENDRRKGLYHRSMQFDALDNEDKEGYLEEAEYYLSGESNIGWPNDILRRAAREKIELPLGVS